MLRRSPCLVSPGFHAAKNGRFKEGELQIPPEAYGIKRRKSVSK